MADPRRYRPERTDAALTSSEAEPRGLGSRELEEREIDRLVEQLIDEGHMSREQAMEAVDAFMAGDVESLRNAARYSDQAQRSAITGLLDYLDSGEQESIDYGDVSLADPSVAARAQADPRSREAQYDALERYRDLSTPEMTAVEKFMQAQARAAQERDMRAAREAALRDLETRGVRSGAAEMAAFHGAAQATGRNRMLGDLGAQANAVERAMQALEGYRGTAGDISRQSFSEAFSTGSAADAVNQFNAQQRNDYQRERARFRLDQQEARFGRRRDVTDRKIDRSRDVFGRRAAVADASGYALGQRINALTGRNPIQEGLMLALGQQEAEQAKEALEKDEGFDPLDPDTWKVDFIV